MYEIEGKPVPLENQTSPIEAVNVTSSSESVPSDAISVGPLQEARMHEFFPGGGQNPDCPSALPEKCIGSEERRQPYRELIRPANKASSQEWRRSQGWFASLRSMA